MLLSGLVKHEPPNSRRKAAEDAGKFLWCLCDSSLYIFHLFDHRISELRSSGLAANVASEFLSMAIDAFKRIADLCRSVMFSEVTNHQQSRTQQGSRIGQVL